MYKNVASQKVALFAFDATTNVPKTGDGANITAYVSKDHGTVTALTDTSATEFDATNAPGVYWFDVSQTETNANELMFTAKSSTANIKIVPRFISTIPANFATTSIDSNGRVDVIKVAGTTQTARDIGASVLLSPGTGTGQLDITSGVVKSNLSQILGTALTETAGQIAAAFKQFFNIGSPTSTMNTITTVTTATNLTNAPTNGDLTATMKTSVTTAATAATPTAAAVTGNVGGNVVGSIGSLAAQAKADVNAEVDSALDTAIPGTPTANSINERIQTMDNAYTSTRAGYLDNINNAGLATTAAQTGDTFALANGSSGFVATKADTAAILLDTGTDGVIVATNNDKTNYRLGATGVSDISAEILTTALTEAYAAVGAAPTLSQLLFYVQQTLTEFSISGTTITTKKLDGTTTAATHTLDSSTSPTSRARAT